MKKLSLWWTRTPFRKWHLSRITKRYYSEYFGELRGKTVLEIGCGSGVGAGIILKYFAPQKIVATDLDPRLVALAKKRLKAKEVLFEVADATNFIYKDESFDAVFVYGVIHHIPTPDWKRSLGEIRRVLKPGGKFFLWDVSIESFDTMAGKIIKLLTVHPYSRMYKRQEFTDYINTIGFETIKTARESRYFIVVAKK